MRSGILLCALLAASVGAAEPGNDISLREYVDVRIESLEKSTALALTSAQTAVSKAEVATERRFESVNEFRAALNDNSRTLMPRAEAEAAFKAMTEKIDLLTSRVNARDEQGRGLNQGWVILVALVAVVASVISIIYAMRRPQPS